MSTISQIDLYTTWAQRLTLKDIMRPSRQLNCRGQLCTQPTGKMFNTQAAITVLCIWSQSNINHLPVLLNNLFNKVNGDSKRRGVPAFNFHPGGTNGAAFVAVWHKLQPNPYRNRCLYGELFSFIFCWERKKGNIYTVKHCHKDDHPYTWVIIIILDGQSRRRDTAETPPWSNVCMPIQKRLGTYIIHRRSESWID